MTDVAARSGAGQRTEIIALKRYMPALAERFVTLVEIDRSTIRYTWRIYRGAGSGP
jgi:hypothetical protein